MLNVNPSYINVQFNQKNVQFRSRKGLLLYAQRHMHREKQKEEPSAALTGTYEELYSNWRNKVEQAAKGGDVFSSFMNMCSFHYMLSDISSEFDI